jgi:hypothetical protein
MNPKPTEPTSRFLSKLGLLLQAIEESLPFYLDALDEAPDEDTQAHAKYELDIVLRRYFIYLRPRARVYILLLDPQSYAHTNLQYRLGRLDRIITRWLENYP